MPAGRGEIATERLILRRWRPRDLLPFAAMNADPRVAEFLPAPLTRAESERMMEGIEYCFERDGFGLWALELPGEADFIGFTGLARVDATMPFAPAVEIGWRLARGFWGRGLATEAARVALRAGFEQHGLEQIVSFTYVGNRRSQAVMERIGMARDHAGDFIHPRLGTRHRLGAHVLYRLARPARGPIG